MELFSPRFDNLFGFVHMKYAPMWQSLTKLRKISKEQKIFISNNIERKNPQENHIQIYAWARVWMRESKHVWRLIWYRIIVNHHLVKKDSLFTISKCIELHNKFCSWEGVFTVAINQGQRWVFSKPGEGRLNPWQHNKSNVLT